MLTYIAGFTMSAFLIGFYVGHRSGVYDGRCEAQLEDLEHWLFDSEAAAEPREDVKLAWTETWCERMGRG